MSSSKTSVDAGKKVRFDASAANDAGFLTSVVYESTNKQKKIYLTKPSPGASSEVTLRSIEANVSKLTSAGISGLEFYEAVSFGLGNSDETSNVVTALSSSIRSLGDRVVHQQPKPKTIISVLDTNNAAIDIATALDENGHIKDFHSECEKSKNRPPIRVVGISSSVSLAHVAPGCTDTVTISYKLKLPIETVTCTYGRTKYTHTGFTEPCITKQVGAEWIVFIQSDDFEAGVRITSSGEIVSDMNAVYTKLADALRPHFLKDVKKVACAGADTVVAGDSLRRVKQSYVDKDGNVVSLSLAEYTDKISKEMGLFDLGASFPINAVRAYADGMNDNLKTELEKTHKGHLDPNLSLSPMAQLRAFADMKNAAVAADKRLSNIYDVVDERMKTTVAFLGVPHASASSLNSSAEQTMKSYEEHTKGKDPENWNDRWVCWSCNERGHRSMSKDGKTVICPNFNKAKHEAKLAELREKRKSKRHKANAKKAAANTATVTDEGNAANAAIGAALIAALSPQRSAANANADAVASLSANPLSFFRTLINAAAGNASSTDTDANGDRKRSASDAHLLVAAVVLNANEGVAPAPIAVSNELPHIKLYLGSEMLPAGNPAVYSVIDSGAALCTGQADFWLAVAEKCPSVVEDIKYSKNAKGEIAFNPITLAGVVGGSEEVTTSLPIVITLKLPYETVNGLPVKLSVALGKNVSVNLILGIPFIKGTKMNMDMADLVADCKLFTCPPFTILERRPAVTIPRAEALDGAGILMSSGDTSHEADIISKVHSARVILAESEE